MDGFAMGPSPTATPNPSRAGSARHGSFERETHSDVFGRRTSTPATTRGNSRVNSPRPSSVRSMMGDEDEDRRSRDRRQDRSEDPVGMRQRLEAIEITLKTHATDIGVMKTQNQEIHSKMTKSDDDHQVLIQKLDRSFAEWNNKMTTIEPSAQRMRDDFQPLMELMSSRVDKLEADFATLMSTHGNPPGMGRDVPQHHIGSPVPRTPPTNSFDSRWNPLKELWVTTFPG